MIRSILVVIPVNDEQDHLPSCVAAIRASRARLAREVCEVEVRVVLVLDSCSDASETIAASWNDAEVIRTATHSVGIARRIGVERALASSSLPLDEVWIANTDADSAVPDQWLTTMFATAENGSHLVLGTVIPEGLTACQQLLWRERHVQAEGHPHVHGANFGIRADVYRTLGGWPAVPTGEDERLARLAERSAGVRIARTARHPVLTSSRLQGRAPLGFSSYLRGLSDRDRRHTRCVDGE